MNTHKLVIASSLLATIGLVGCSSSSSNDPATPGAPTTVSGNITQLGFVNVVQFPGGVANTNQVRIFGSFYESNQAFDSALAVNSVFPAADTCLVDDGGDDVSGPNIEGVDADFTSLTAGDVITITSPAGTYASLTQQTAFGNAVYLSETDLQSPPPSGLVADIPGGQFPAFANVAIPDVVAIGGVSPALNTAVDGSTTFTWTAGTNANARILINVDNVDCVLLDDGSFTLPANIVAQTDSNFGSFGYSIERTAVRLVQSGNTLLGVGSTSESE